MDMFCMPAKRFCATSSGVTINNARQQIAHDTPMDLDA
jgi:hypothetical protein